MSLVSLETKQTIKVNRIAGIPLAVIYVISISFNIANGRTEKIFQNKQYLNDFKPVTFLLTDADQ